MSVAATFRKNLTLEQLVIRFGPVELQRPLTKEEFVALAERYPELQMEREPDGTTTLMSPVRRGSGKRESTLIFLVESWNRQHGGGEVQSSSAGFDLPDGATRSPDVAWISPERLAASTAFEESFVRIVPDFVAEIRSGTDRLKKLQHKMTESWIANGVRLAWLIDPYEEKAYIYRPGQPVEIVEGFADHALSGEDVMPGFELPLTEMRRADTSNTKD